MDTTIDKFPSDVQKFLDDEPELLESIEPYLEADQWSPDNPPSKIEVLIDSLVVAEYKPDDLEMKRDIPDDFITYEIQFNEEPVYFVAQINHHPYEIISRLENIK